MAKAKGLAAKEERHGVVLVFLVLLVLSETVSADMRVLDMSPNAVDDTFAECRDTMMHAVAKPGGLLQKEIAINKDFAEMWSHDETCEKQIHGGTAYHLAALQAYGNSNAKFRKLFNQMVQTKGSNSTIYKNEFPFKSLHFLLTDAIRLLKHNTKCSSVYYSTKKHYTAQTGQEVRFGKFLQADAKSSVATEIIEDEGTVFNITSCSAVNIEHYTCTSEEIEQLIPPTEVFTVQGATEVKNNDSDYKIITLTHSRFLSSHDCYLFSRSSPDGFSSLLLSSTILALTGSFLNVYCTVME